MRIKAKRTINGTPEEIWPYLDDFGNIHRVHPLTQKSAYTEKVLLVK